MLVSRIQIFVENPTTDNWHKVRGEAFDADMELVGVSSSLYTNLGHFTLEEEFRVLAFIREFKLGMFQYLMVDDFYPYREKHISYIKKLGEMLDFEGQKLLVEFAMPVYQYLDGPKLETDWTLQIGWSIEY